MRSAGPRSAQIPERARVTAESPLTPTLSPSRVEREKLVLVERHTD